MEKATALIEGLANEKGRWIEDSHQFSIKSKQLIGDISLGTTRDNIT